jgi:hypothetical protein
VQAIRCGEDSHRAEVARLSNEHEAEHEQLQARHQAILQQQQRASEARVAALQVGPAWLRVNAVLCGGMLWRGVLCCAVLCGGELPQGAPSCTQTLI